MSTLSQPSNLLRAVVRAVGLLTVGLAVLVGPPVALSHFIGNPLPSAIPTIDEISFAISTGQIDAWTWVKALAIVGWLAWAHLATSVTVEVVAAIRGGKARAVRGLGLTQWFASRLVAQLSLVASVTIQSSTAPAAFAVPPLPATTLVVEADAGADAAVAPGLVPAGRGEIGLGSEAAPAEPPGPTITVGRNDTLWGLAERHLGDGSRWDVLRELNVGRTMPDGTVLSPNLIRLEQGWRLVLPRSAAPGAASAALGSSGESPPAGAEAAIEVEIEIEIEGGDNLWRLSEQQLSARGVEPRPAEVLDLVNEVIDRNTAIVDDPDLIYPGQVFAFPRPPERPQPPTPTEQPPASDQGEVAVAEDATITAGPDATAARDTAGPDATAARDTAGPDAVAALDTAGVDTGDGRSAAGGAELELAHAGSIGSHEPAGGGAVGSEVLRTVGTMSIGAAGALLAVGALRLLRRRRRYRMAHRSPGTVPAPPASELNEIELALQRRGDEELVTWLEAALGSLSTRPVWEGEPIAQPMVVRLIGSGEVLEVEFSEPDPMGAPLPWSTTNGGAHWQLDRATMIDDLPRGGVAAVPTLVTVGVDTLVNLEGAGVVAIPGEGDGPLDLVRSMVHELATSPAAGSIDIRTTVPIAGTETYRLVQAQSARSLVAELVPWLEDVGRQLEHDECSNIYAHRLTTDDEPVGPVVIVTDEAGLAALDPLPHYAALRRLPFALVVAGAADTAEVTIEVGPDEAILRPGGRRFEPQRLTEAVAESLGELLLDAEQGGSEPLVVGVELSASVTDLRARLDETARQWAPRPEHEPALGVGVEPEGAGAAPTPALAGRPTPTPTGVARADAAGQETTPDGGGEDEGEEAPAILIRVLGDVEAEGAPDLTSQQLSILTYLACHGPSTRDTLIDSLWDGQVISESRFPNLLAEVRARVGRNHLPEARSGRYTLSGVATDLARFERGVRVAAKQADAQAVVTLREIMALVRGMPLSPPGRRFWSWVGDETHMAARVEALVADTAARLARLEQAASNLDRAVWACEQGLLASPTDETLVITLTEVYLALGKPGLAHRVVDNWEDKISRMDCGEPSDEPRRRLAG